MLQDWYKDGMAYQFEMYKYFTNKDEYEHRDKVLLREGYLPVYDRRNLSFPHHLPQGSAILENDSVCPEYLINLQNDISQGYGANRIIPDIKEQMTSFNPGHIPILKEHVLNKRKVKNILIDSLFKDIDQFRYVVIKCFADFIGCNFFINSHGSLIDTLNKELKENMDKYPIRNPYYTHQNGEKWFNELTFTIIKNKIYEIEVVDGKVEYLTRLKFQNGYNTHSVILGQKQKYLYGNYKTEKPDEEVEKPKSNKWEL